MRPLYIELDDIIMQAFREGRDVTIERAEDYGYHIVVDGVAITDSGGGEGLPRETFSWPLDYHRTEEAEEMVRELTRGYTGHRADRQNERVETGPHSASEGVDDEA